MNPPQLHPSPRSLVRAIRDLLEHHGIALARLTLLRRRIGYVFRVDTRDGQRYTLRVRPKDAMSRGTADALRRWMSALARDPDVTVPDPVRIGRRYVAQIDGYALAMFRWVEGRHIGGAEAFVRSKTLAAMGRAT